MATVADAFDAILGDFNIQSEPYESYMESA